MPNDSQAQEESCQKQRRCIECVRCSKLHKFSIAMSFVTFKHASSTCNVRLSSWSHFSDLGFIAASALCPIARPRAAAPILAIGRNFCLRTRSSARLRSAKIDGQFKNATFSCAFLVPFFLPLWKKARQAPGLDSSMIFACSCATSSALPRLTVSAVIRGGAADAPVQALDAAFPCLQSVLYTFLLRRLHTAACMHLLFLIM